MISSDKASVSLPRSSICLLKDNARLRRIAQSRSTTQQIFAKFSRVRYGIRKNPLDFGGNPDLVTSVSGYSVLGLTFHARHTYQVVLRLDEARAEFYLQR